MKVKNQTKKGYLEVSEGGCFDLAFPNSKYRRGRVIGGGRITNTLDTGCNIGVVMKDSENIENLRVRKLTPRECFRLQGFPDEYFDRAAEVCSDSQLYKQAGNSVTVNVIYEIAKRLEGDEMNKEDFKVGEYIVYRNGDKYEIGRIASITDTGAFVCYHEGETAAKTGFDLMHKIVNDYVIKETSLGGERFKDPEQGGDDE